MITTEWDRCKAAFAGNVGDDENPDTLVPITSVTSRRTWDYSLPTLTQPRRFTPRRTFSSVNGNKDFLDIIKNHNNGLTYLLLDAVGVFGNKTNLVLYGGSLLDIVLQREDEIKDWDFRLIGMEFRNNEQKCIDRAKEFVSTIFATLRTRNKSLKEENARFKREGNTHSVQQLLNLSTIQTSRRNKTITVNIPSHGRFKELSFQLKFDPYSNVQQLLSSCTPHCRRIAIQDNTVWVDQAARYCIENVCIVATPDLFSKCLVDTEQDITVSKQEEEAPPVKLSTRSLKNLFDKGFDIILPDLDMSKVPTRNLKYKVSEVLELPFLAIIYDSITMNKIMVKEIRFDFTVDEDSETHQRITNSVGYNVRLLVNNVYDKFQYVADGEEYEQVIFDAVPRIFSRGINNLYENVFEDIVGDNNDKIVKSIQGYFNSTAPADVVEQLFVVPLRTEIASNVSSSSSSEIQSSPEEFAIDEELVESLIEKEKNVLVKEKLIALPEIMKKICGDNLTPIIENVNDTPADDVLLRAFYGPYRKQE